MHTCPSCTHHVCTPDEQLNASRLPPRCLSNWAKCLDTGACTCPAQTTQLPHLCCQQNKSSQTTAKVQSSTSGERLHIYGGMQIQHAGLLNAPSDRGTSPDGAPAHRQSVLQTARGHLKGRGVKIDFLEHKDSPGCLASLGLMQRTYQGSLDRRISVRPVRLFLN